MYVTELSHSKLVLQGSVGEDHYLWKKAAEAQVTGQALKKRPFWASPLLWQPAMGSTWQRWKLMKFPDHVRKAKEVARCSFQRIADSPIG